MILEMISMKTTRKLIPEFAGGDVEKFFYSLYKKMLHLTKGNENEGLLIERECILVTAWKFDLFALEGMLLSPQLNNSHF